MNYCIMFSRLLLYCVTHFVHEWRCYTVKKVREFPVPIRDVTTQLSLGGNNDGTDVITKLFLPRGCLVSRHPGWRRETREPFLRCIDQRMNNYKMKSVLLSFPGILRIGKSILQRGNNITCIFKTTILTCYTIKGHYRYSLNWS